LLVAAGVPVAEALEDAAEATEHPRLVRALTRVRAAVREGRPLADALAACPDEFPAIYRELVRASEAAGALAPVLGRLAAYLERPGAIRARLRAALAYPAVMALAVTAVLIFLLTWVLPQMAQLFAETGAPLPLPTRALLLAGTVASRTWAAWLLALAVGAVALRSWLASRAGRAPFYARVLGLRAVGRLVGAAALARAAHTLATLLAGGVRLEVALDLAAATAGNARIAAALTAARDAVRQGQPLAPALRASGVVPASVLRLVATRQRRRRPPPPPPPPPSRRRRRASIPRWSATSPRRPRSSSRPSCSRWGPRCSSWCSRSSSRCFASIRWAPHDPSRARRGLHAPRDDARAAHRRSARDARRTARAGADHGRAPRACRGGA